MKKRGWRLLLGLWPQVDGATVRPESSSGETGLGPDFPTSAGDRERGKFRKSKYARLDTIAVVTDDGEPIARRTEELLADILLEVRNLTNAIEVKLKEDD